MATSTKYVSVKYNTSLDTPTSIERVFVGAVSDPSLIGVSYNGQRINRRTTESVSSANSFGKYFYELIMGSQSFILKVRANQFYRPVKYAITEPVAAYTFSDTDVITVEYTYTF